ncbi:MAG TPA: peroxiredoxin [Polyangiaceae bacterium]|jgi:peroxiredoxin Q/BCP
MGKQLGKKLAAGDSAPAFDLPSDSGENVKLGDFKGHPVVLYFYPKDNTPGCTREAQAFTKLAPAFKKAGATVLGVSKDSVDSHCGFRDKLKLKIPLLSDPGLDVHKAYGAYGEKVLYGKKTVGVIRSTFLIDGKGKIARAWSSVKVDGHAESVLEAVKALDA